MDTKRIARLALLTAAALILFTAEAQLPPPVPIPGVKLGLANIITVYAMFRFGPRDTLLILLSRVLLGSLVTGAVSALIFSLSGGLLCYLVMLALRRVLTENQLWVCGVIGAVFHNVGQILACVLVYQTAAVLAYLPALTLSGIVTGLFTGLAASFLLKRLKGQL